MLPESVQVPEVTDHDRTPAVCPPDAVSASVEPVVNNDALVMEIPVWFALPIDTVVFEEFATL